MRDQASLNQSNCTWPGLMSKTRVTKPQTCLNFMNDSMWQILNDMASNTRKILSYFSSHWNIRRFVSRSLACGRRTAVAMYDVHSPILLSTRRVDSKPLVQSCVCLLLYVCLRHYQYCVALCCYVFVLYFVHFLTARSSFSALTLLVGSFDL